MCDCRDKTRDLHCYKCGDKSGKVVVVTNVSDTVIMTKVAVALNVVSTYVSYNTHIS